MAPAAARRLSRRNVNEQQSGFTFAGAEKEQLERPSSTSEGTTASSSEPDSGDNIHSVLGVRPSFILMLEDAEARDMERLGSTGSPRQKLKRAKVPTTHDKNPQQRRRFVLDYSRNPV